LLVVREPEQIIVQASDNAGDVMGFPGCVLGHPLSALPGNLAACIGPHLHEKLDTLPVAVRCQSGCFGVQLDVLLHRPPEGGLVIELERAGLVVSVSEHMERGLKSILSADSVDRLCAEAARIFRDITGYDQVMVNRVDETGRAETVSEERRSELDTFLGNGYLASNISPMTRALYERNRVRVVADVNYAPVPLTPALSPITGAHLDMSLCILRGLSPMRAQCLKSMGVGATLVASIVVGGRLWGLVSCHHAVPRPVQFEIRAACQLLAEAVATRIAALESFAQGQAETAARRLETRMFQAISQQGDWRRALFDTAQAVLCPLKAAGAALLFEDEVQTLDNVPSVVALREIGAWLDEQPPAPVFATASLGLDAPRFQALMPVASGMVAARLSGSAGEYLIWFRPEKIRTLTSDGNAFNPLTQRRQLVETTSEPWSVADLTAARLIGASVTDLVTQVRAIRTLIAQDQLKQVRQQVGRLDRPVIIGDEQGRVILANEAFRRLLTRGQDVPPRIEDLASCCTEARDLRRQLRDLLDHGHMWRGEIGMKTGQGEVQPLMVKAEPVFASPGRVLGFIVLFSDLAERKASEAARRRFQEGMVTDHRIIAEPRGTQPGLPLQSLLSSLVENAQLAALEITDGTDLARMPDMLESVRASVARAAEVLGHLVRQVSNAKPQS